jgi:hypothetical protein
MGRARKEDAMSTIRHPALLAAAAAFMLLLSACDKLRSTEPPPSFQSPTVGVAQEIGGTQASPAATPPSTAASGK